MKKHPIIRACWFAVNVLLAVSLVAVLYGAGWEFSTRSYLKGFSDAIIPASDDTEQKVEAILQWMAHGPVRRSSADPADLPGAQSGRNAQHSTTSASLRHGDERVREPCADQRPARAATSLIGSIRVSKHVVVEVLIGDRWVVVDPSYHFIIRLPDGHFPPARS